MGLKEGWLPGQLSFSTLASLAHRRSWSEAKCRASRQVGGGDAMLLLLPAYGAPARWECADIRDMRGGI